MVISGPPWVVPLENEDIELTADQVYALQRSPIFTGEQPQRVFVLGDSISLREYQTIANVTCSVNGYDLTLTTSAANIPLGAGVRMTNQAGVREYQGVVISSDTSTVVARFPVLLDGLVTSPVNVFFFSRLNDTGWPVYLRGQLAQIGKPLNLITNAAFGGAKVAEMYARVGTMITPYAAPGDIAIVMGGINDVELSSAATIITYLRAIYEELMQRGVTVIAGTISPVYGANAFGTPASAATWLAVIAEVNRFVRSYARSFGPRIRLWDTEDELIDGSYAEAGTMEVDGPHPTPFGAQRMAARLVTDCGDLFRYGALRRWLSPADDYVDSSSWNLLANAGFAGATGTTAPTGWTASLGGGTNSLTLSNGVEMTMSKAHTSGNALTVSQDVTARIQAGQRYIHGTEYEVMTLGQGHYFYCDVVFSVGGYDMIYGIGRNQLTVANGGRLADPGTRFFLELASGNNDGRNGWIAPVGFTSATFRYTMRLDSSGSCAVKVARPHLYRVT